ncbi:hypothetical protein [Paracoccus benzoatiresistens]|uniref:Uncharacterized protein n=1 Tax=Paracoccus benzoatiresistens TaxID=2997341 RepID=A0ABT4J9V9_9RHOB|nr:hypothetical protein [Paracoccus sp. EF6]MCZ0963236.1 hypothetical protein [Paracoccus sp. EF6]
MFIQGICIMVGLVGRLGFADLLLGINEEDNGLTGDADEMSGRQAGRRDLLVSRRDNNTLVASHTGSRELYGCAYQMLGQPSGGEDRMQGNAKVRGDIHLGEASESEGCAVPPQTDKTTGGIDNSVFRPGAGGDTIHDFHIGRDVSNLQGFGSDLEEFGQMVIIQDGKDFMIAFTGLAEGDIRFG